MIAIKNTGNCLVFSIKNTQRLDFSVSDILMEKIEKELGYHRANNYAIDLESIHFIDSHSFNILLQVNNMLDRLGKKLYILNVSESAKELFELTGLNAVLTIVMEDMPMDKIACYEN